MILPMLKSLGRSIFTFFARPAPTSVALMVGSAPGSAANDDQSQMLRRAMQAATAAEDARDDDVPEIVQIFEPIADDETDDSAAAQAAVFAPAKPMPAAPANDAQTHDAVEEPPFEQSAAPIEMADWVVVEIDEMSEPAAEMFVPLDVLSAVEAPATDAPVETAANDVEALPVADEPLEDEPIADEPAPIEAAVEDDEVEAAREDVVVEAVADETVSEAVTEAAVSEDPAPVAAEKKARKKRAPAKRKAAAKPRKAKAAGGEAAAEPVPDDDVWVSDAVAWSLSGEWTDGAQLPAESSDCPRRLEELREAAAEGRLTVWGRSGDAGTWQPIEASYWKSGTVEPASLTQGRENVVAEPKTKGKAKAARKYSALKVSRAQVEELWQPDAMH